MINSVRFASLLNKNNDAFFQSQLAVAISEIERQLGYPLSNSFIAEERIFILNDNLWKRVHPFYGVPEYIKIFSNDGNEKIIHDYQLGQNGKLVGNWFNGFRLKNHILSKNINKLEEIKISATWGFAKPVQDSNQNIYYYLPENLEKVILEAIKNDNDSKIDIQSENTGTRNYQKFASSYKSVWEKYDGIIEYYRHRESRF